MTTTVLRKHLAEVIGVKDKENKNNQENKVQKSLHSN